MFAVRGCVSVAMMCAGFVLSGCGMMETTSNVDDAAVQNHALYGSDINSAAVKADRYKNADTGTSFEGKRKTKGAADIAAEKLEHVQKADAEYRLGNYEVALYEYVRGLIIDPKDAQLYYKVGVLQAAKGKLQLADLALRRATELEPDFVAALDQYGQLNLKLRRYDRAAELFHRAIDNDRIRVANTRPDGAKAGVDEQSPFNAYNGLGVIEDMRGNFGAAQQHYIMAQQIRPESVELINNIGYSLYLNGQIDRAESMFRQAMMLDPSFSKSWYNLALVYVRNGRYQDAVVLLTDKSGDAASANNTVGYLSMIEGKHEQANMLFNQAIELSPVYFNLAYQNRERNRLRTASTER